MCDALAVLGSRHGLMIDPIRSECALIRFDFFDLLPRLHLRAGIIIDGEEFVFPLCPDGKRFDFVDQRMTPCTMSLSGIHGPSAIKAKLTIATPFRPRDAAFSTTPVLALRLEARQLSGQYRWESRQQSLTSVDVFLEISGEGFERTEHGDDSIDMRFTSKRFIDHIQYNTYNILTEDMPQQDRLTAVVGRRSGMRFTHTVALSSDEDTALVAAWCTHSAPALEIHGERCAFRYHDTFADLDAVTDWARRNTMSIIDNAARVDSIVGRNRCGASLNHLLAQTLHSWLINTWWVRRGGREWFSVWEGTCYFHSTVDVEYTQSPFYLAVWPELLAIELDFWPESSLPGEEAIGPRGKGTLFLAHDVGKGCRISGQGYEHHMAVEETTNYIIMAYAYHRRTGDDSLLRRHEQTILKYLAFLEACDTDGSGVPNVGVANTIDDAAPAIQFGREQTYLAVKTLAAFTAGAAIVEFLGHAEPAAHYRRCAEPIRTRIHNDGWLEDHFAVLLDKRGQGVIDPRTGTTFDVEELPGWDSYHIYTANGMAVLDMVGLDLGIDREKVRIDLENAAQHCLREYGCVHLDFSNTYFVDESLIAGLAGNALNPGWISMNILRDLAAFYRGVDLRHLADRYWEWQTTTNTQEPKIFFETFNGNNLSFYPRGIAVWGVFDALAGLVIDRVKGTDCAARPLPGIRVPRLYDASWETGECAEI